MFDNMTQLSLNQLKHLFESLDLYFAHENKQLKPGDWGSHCEPTSRFPFLGLQNCSSPGTTSPTALIHITIPDQNQQRYLDTLL